MKASELIEELRKSIEMWGDWPVIANTGSHMGIDRKTGEIVAIDPSEVSNLRAIVTNAGQAKKIVIE